MISLKGNRKVFFLPVNTGFSKNQTPDSRCIEFYRERSGNGLHCAIVGNVVIPSGVGSNDSCAKISEDIAWKRLADAISESGSIAGIQLSTCWPGYKGMKKFIPKSINHNLNVYREIALSITKNDVIDAFAKLMMGSNLAASAGFKHIQVHAAHGYLFNLMIDSRFSRHHRLALDKLLEWSELLVEHEIESSIRLSLATGAAELDDTKSDKIFDTIADLPINYLDLSSGFYNLNKRLIYPSTDELLSERITSAINLAHRHPHTSFIVSGKSLIGYKKNLPANVHIGVCRDIIANPNFLNDTSNGCQNKMKCHYHSRGQNHIICGKWKNP